MYNIVGAPNRRYVIPADILYIVFDYSQDFEAGKCFWRSNPGEWPAYNRVQEVAIINNRINESAPVMPRLKFLRCNGRIPTNIPRRQLQVLHSYYSD